MWWCGIAGVCAMYCLISGWVFLANEFTAGCACVRLEVILVVGSLIHNKLYRGTTQVPTRLPVSVGLAVLFCSFSLVSLFFFWLSNTNTRIMYDIMHASIILLWATWRDQFKDWASSRSDELEIPCCSVSSFSVMLWTPCKISCYRQFTVFHMVRSLKLMQLSLCIYNLPLSDRCIHTLADRFGVLLRAFFVGVSDGFLLFVCWPRHVLFFCYGILAPYVLFFRSSDNLHWICVGR